MPFLPCKRYHRHGEEESPSFGHRRRRRRARAGAGVAAGGSRPVTIRDVAALSGVSIATVTRTFQGSPQVRPETSARVLASAERLGYRPDSIARALVTGTSNTTGVCLLLLGHWRRPVTAPTITPSTRLPKSVSSISRSRSGRPSQSSPAARSSRARWRAARSCRRSRPSRARRVSG